MSVSPKMDAAPSPKEKATLDVEERADENMASPVKGMVEAEESNPKLDAASDVNRSTSRLKKSSLTTQLSRISIGICTTPCQLYWFFVMLYRKFGGYVPMVVFQYGLNQGIGMSMGNMARRVYFANVLQLDGATSGRYVAAAMVPWSIKPMFGMLSDAVPILGYHRTSYIVFAGICGVVAWTTLGVAPLAGVATVPFLVLMNISVSMPDVMIDAKTAELSKDEPRHASDLQSLSWGALAIGGLVTCSTSGLLVDTVGPRIMFLCINVCALGILIPGLLNWWGEKRVSASSRNVDTAWLKRHAPIVVLAAYMSLMAVTLSILQIAVESKVARGVVTAVFAIILVIGIFTVLRRVSPILAKTAIYIFARECLQPGTGEAMFQWLMNHPGGPQFSPTVLSWIDCFGSLGLLLGVTVYNKFLSEVPYRKIFIGAQLAVAFCGLFDLVLVKRWNLAIGIPDIVMLIGDDALTVTMRRFFVMPMFILAAKVCPTSVEATLFAMLMALSNFGATVSEFLGVSMLEAFGVVDGNFDRLSDVILAKSFCRILPILIVPLLVPNLKPSDPIIEENNPEANNPEADPSDTKPGSVGVADVDTSAAPGTSV